MIRARAVRTAVAAAGFALAAAVTTITPAAASTAGAAVRPMSTESTESTPHYYTDVPPGGRVSCFGYYGTFLAGSRVVVVDWVHTSDECFGIATDRTIWHAWVGSGGWQRMPGTFYADDIAGIRDESADGTKGIRVREDTIYHHSYYQLYTPSAGWSGIWHEYA